MTDFATWDRETLNEYAEAARAEIEALREELRIAIDAYRKLIVEQETRMLEKNIEAKVCGYARERGLLAYKFTSPAHSAVPDRLFILPGGKMFFCEFKREKQKPTPAQEREHLRLRQHKVSVYVIDNVDDGLRMVDEMLAGM